MDGIGTGAPDLGTRLQAALGPAYAVGRELGGGGMSRVFVARDVALDRDVVVKVLAPDLAGGLSVERFAREVRLAARLQHANVVPVLSAGALDGLPYYTMPFVEGESLRARLERHGPLPVRDTVSIMRDVARALAYAHRAGVVHRDVKPENVLLSHGGAVVADFGIAKAIRAARAPDGDGHARRSSTLTAAGTSLGTPAYMAPEQAVADAVDHRADLYALGVVGYEMLAGRTPFDGRTAQQQLAAHATMAPEPVARQRPAVPPALAALVMRLLEKNPADRPQTADELLRALEDIGDASHAPSTSRGGARLPRVAAWLAFGAACAAAGALLGAWGLRRPEAPRRAVVAAIAAPVGYELRPDAGLALSPDGARLAFVAADLRGATAVWIRPLDSLAAVRIAGTDGGSGPFWSPDGASLGFFARGRLQVAELRGGAPRVLCAAPRPGGGAWTTAGEIVYSPDFLSVPLFRVAAAGGPCTRLTREARYARPAAFGDGRRVLFSGSPGGDALVVDPATGAVAALRRGARDAQFAAPHWLLFRNEAGGPLFAQRLDMRSLRPLGEPHVLLDRTSSFRDFPSYTVAPRTLVAFQPSGVARSLVWADRQSNVVDSVPAPPDDGFRSVYNSMSAALSGDGRQVAFAAVGAAMWLHDRDRDVATRLRAETMAGQAVLDADWGPGDSLIAYRTLLAGSLMLRVYHVGTGTSDSLFASGRRNVRSPDWSPDGRSIAFGLTAGDSAARDEIWVYSVADRRATRLWDGVGNHTEPRWSPDGRWLAYVSDETGAPEVYVRPVSGAGIAQRVSTAGGEVPRWRTGGRELYYRAPDGAIMVVGATLGATAALSTPRVAVASPPFSQTARTFEVTADGERFVGFRREAPPVFTLVLDWPARLPAR